MNNEEKWIEELRRRMEGHSEPLPDGLWEEIERDMKTPKIIPFRRVWQAAAVILVLVASSLSVWFWSTPTADFSNQEESVRQLSEVPGKPQEIQLPPLPASAPAEHQTLARSESSIHKLHTPNTAETFPVLTGNETEDTQESVPAESVAPEEKKDKSEKQHQTQTFKASRTSDRKQMERNADALQIKERMTGRKFGLSINSGNTPFASSNNFGGMGRLAMVSSHQVADLMGSLNDGSTAYRQVLFENRELTPVTHINHHVPVTVGISFRWEFVPDWSLETGVMYTLLVSELRSGENAYVDEEQRLHYVGIPLKIQRSIWKNNRFNIYASTGGAVEKCVAGQVETTYVFGREWEEREKTSLDIDPLQWSVSAGIGAQVNFTRQVGLYIEPGIAYYFDDNSPIETIRKEHPLNFNLQLGLRFSMER